MHRKEATRASQFKEFIQLVKSSCESESELALMQISIQRINALDNSTAIIMYKYSFRKMYYRSIDDRATTEPLTHHQHLEDTGSLSTRFLSLLGKISPSKGELAEKKSFLPASLYIYGCLTSRRASNALSHVLSSHPGKGMRVSWLSQPTYTQTGTYINFRQ